MKRMFVFFINLFFAMSVIAQEKHDVPFNGLIMDMAGNPAKGAKIYIEKGLSTRSDKKGRFGLTNVLPTDTIKIEYQKKIYFIPVEGRKSIRINIGDQIDNLARYNAEEDNELVDLGYTYVKRRESIESTGGISGEALIRSGATNLLDALRGRIAGVQINGDKILIRGISSVNSGTDPLLLVDGCEVSSLEGISLYDVQSVEVLKEGSMYGMRGANGVIIVRTISGSR